VPTIERLRPDHAAALLTFEQENRTYFAATIPDRGDDYFIHFTERHEALLAEQATGACHFHLIVGDGGVILGRVNLVDVADGEAELGFRIAEKAAGQGLATTSVRKMARLAATTYRLKFLRAGTSATNTGSQKVLTRIGFTLSGEELVLSGRPGLRYTLDLTATT
jgi:[ribosomal protein S5]-alanine N-acetyltransferase